MTFAEFRQWAWECHRYRISDDDLVERRAVWGRRGVASGDYRANYTMVEQRRFAFWLRARPLIHQFHLYEWLDHAEKHDTGWLINQGDGIWWTENPETVAHDLIQTGFIAIRCGVEG